MPTFPTSAFAQGTKRSASVQAYQQAGNGPSGQTRGMSSLSLGTIMVWALPLVALVALVGESLWASEMLLSVLAAFGPRTSIILKMLEVLAAAAVCSLALVNVGA